VAVLAVAVLAGCAASPPADTAALPRYYEIGDLIKAVAAQQRADQTARLSLRGEITGLDAEERIRFTGDGVLRVAADAVSLKFTQVVRRRGSPPQETGFVVLPDAVYLRMPHEAGSSAKPWVRVDPSSSEHDDRVLASLADTLAASAEPMSSLARYADATLVTDAADDLVDGAPAVRYTLVVDLARAAMLETDQKRRAQLQNQVRSGLNRVTSRLWLDAAGRPVRSDVRQQLPGIGMLAITGSYREWGRPVEIAAPAPSQVR
jgi:hypothetical protein